MNRKMYSFLLSIGIEDPERFDMDFSLVGRNPRKKEQVDLFIQKDTPCDYALLAEFIPE